MIFIIFPGNFRAPEEEHPYPVTYIFIVSINSEEKWQ